MKRNAIKNAGRIFGHVCVGIGIMMILFTMPLIVNESKEIPINLWAVIAEFIGVALYIYGAWRSGFRKR